MRSFIEFVAMHRAKKRRRGVHLRRTRFCLLIFRWKNEISAREYLVINFNTLLTSERFRRYTRIVSNARFAPGRLSDKGSSCEPIRTSMADRPSARVPHRATGQTAAHEEMKSTLCKKVISFDQSIIFSNRDIHQFLFLELCPIGSFHVYFFF